MSSYGYDAENDELNLIGGTPKQLLNQALGRATGAITNEGDAFDATRTSANPYLVGDYVIYNNTMYECTTQHYGAWDSSHFTQRNIGDVLTTLNSALNQYARNQHMLSYTHTYTWKNVSNVERAIKIYYSIQAQIIYALNGVNTTVMLNAGYTNIKIPSGNTFQVKSALADPHVWFGLIDRTYFDLVK